MNKPFGVPEWYYFLSENKKYIRLTANWILHRSSETTVEMLREDGEMCRAVVEEDGLCRVKDIATSLPEEVIDQLRCLLNLVEA